MTTQIEVDILITLDARRGMHGDGDDFVAVDLDGSRHLAASDGEDDADAAPRPPL